MSNKRPIELPSTTYKLKVPTISEAFYITISDMSIDGVIKPRELFINTKNMTDLSWITTISRLISTLFRTCNNPQIVIDELRAVYDPNGGFFIDGSFIPSVSTAIGNIIAKHVDKLNKDQNVIKKYPKFDINVIDNSKEEFCSKVNTEKALKNAMICPKCNEKGLILRDGCNECLLCGYSKCGG